MNPCCRSIREAFQRHDTIAGCAPHVGLVQVVKWVEVMKGQITPHLGVGEMYFTDMIGLQNITFHFVSGHVEITHRYRLLKSMGAN